VSQPTFDVLRDHIDEIFATTRVGVWELRIAEERFVCDQSLYALFGLRREDDDDQYTLLSQYFTPIAIARMNQKIGEALETGGSYEEQFSAKHRSGHEIHLRSRGRIFQDAQRGVRVLGVIWDVTEEVEREAEVERHKASALASSKMAVLGEMASGIAHEINNPLATIRGTLEVLSMKITKRLVTQEQLLERLDYLIRISDRIAAIIKGLRLFAREGSGDPLVNESIRGIVNDTLSFCRHRLKSSQIDLEVAAIPEDWTLECRAVQISQVLLNFMNNALDALQGQSGAWIRISVTLSSENRYFFRVTDSGPGIPPELREKVFQPFFTTKEVGAGTGLGLSVSQGIAQSLGGKIWIDAQAPNTSFVLELPARQPKQSAIAA
jgi:PAS domain S-box-containing protein